MANAYSIERNRLGWIDPYDQDFLLKAMLSKQQKYDANSAKIQGIIDQTQNLALAKDIDSDYLKERLGTLLKGVNQYGAQDLSLNSVTSNINSHVGQAVDTNVTTAINQTAAIREYNAYIKEVRKNNPELYNSLNDAYSFSPAGEYLRSTKVGDKINGKLMYRHYEDVEGLLAKELTEMQKNAKDGIIPYPDGKGGILEVNINGLDQAALKDIASARLGHKYDEQLRIYAWGETNGFKDVKSHMTRASGYYSNVVGNLEKNVTSLKGYNTNENITANEKAMNETQINLLSNKINVYKGLLDTSKNTNLSEEQVATFLTEFKKDRLTDSSAAAYAALQSRKTKFLVDEKFFKSAELQIKTLETNSKINLDTANAEYLRAKVQNLANGGNDPDNPNGSGKTGSGTKTGTSKEEKDAEENEIIYKASPSTDAKASTAGFTSEVSDMLSKNTTAANNYGATVLTRLNEVANDKTGQASATQQGELKLLKETLKKDKTLATMMDTDGNFRSDLTTHERFKLLSRIYRPDSRDLFSSLHVLNIEGKKSAHSENLSEENAYAKFNELFANYASVNNGKMALDKDFDARFKKANPNHRGAPMSKLEYLKKHASKAHEGLSESDATLYDNFIKDARNEDEKLKLPVYKSLNNLSAVSAGESAYFSKKSKLDLFKDLEKEYKDGSYDTFSKQYNEAKHNDQIYQKGMERLMPDYAFQGQLTIKMGPKNIDIATNLIANSAKYIDVKNKGKTDTEVANGLENGASSNLKESVAPPSKGTSMTITRIPKTDSSKDQTYRVDYIADISVGKEQGASGNKSEVQERSVVVTEAQLNKNMFPGAAPKIKQLQEASANLHNTKNVRGNIVRFSTNKFGLTRKNDSLASINLGIDNNGEYKDISDKDEATTYIYKNYEKLGAKNLPTDQKALEEYNTKNPNAKSYLSQETLSNFSKKMLSFDVTKNFRFDTDSELKDGVRVPVIRVVRNGKGIDTMTFPDNATQYSTKFRALVRHAPEQIYAIMVYSKIKKAMIDNTQGSLDMLNNLMSTK